MSETQVPAIGLASIGRLTTALADTPFVLCEQVAKPALSDRMSAKSEYTFDSYFPRGE